MLFLFGSILAGVLLYDHLMSEKPSVCELAKESNTNVIYRMKSGEGEISLPPCRLMGVELGSFADPHKAILTLRHILGRYVFVFHLLFVVFLAWLSHDDQ